LIPLRFAVYAAFAVLFASGAAWLVADCMKESAEGEIWQSSAATLLMLHGGTAMLTLMLLGALIPVHIGRAWRARKNCATGIIMAVCNVVLIATAFGLYYLASEALRPWASDIHIAFGLALPLLMLVHVKARAAKAECKRCSLSLERIGGNHFIRHLTHTRHAFSESKERLMFFRGTNKAPKIYDSICHDDIALATVGPGLLRQSGQDRRSDPSIRQLIIFRLGGRRRKRLDEIGTAYDTNKLAILENQDTLDPVFLEDIREFGERVFSSAEIMFPDMSSATLRPCDFA
jgi:hypothetical protein